MPDAVPNAVPGDLPGAAGAEALAAFGPFFAVGVHAPGAAPAPPWRPVSALTVSAGLSGPLADLVASARATLAARGGLRPEEIDLKVAASAVHLGIAARLVAPALGASVLGLSLDPCDAWWQEGTGGPVPLSVAVSPVSPVSTALSPALSGAAVPSRLLHEILVPLTAAVARVVPVSGRVLRGNVASGINAAAGQVARSRPDLAAAAWETARALLADPWLAAERCPPGPGFRRSSCCLFYRLAPSNPPAICGDCVLGKGRS